jgi:serine/threonine protein kinase
LVGSVRSTIAGRQVLGRQSIEESVGSLGSHLLRQPQARFLGKSRNTGKGGGLRNRASGTGAVKSEFSAIEQSRQRGTVFRQTHDSCAELWTHNFTRSLDDAVPPAVAVPYGRRPKRRGLLSCARFSRDPTVVVRRGLWWICRRPNWAQAAEKERASQWPSLPSDAYDVDARPDCGRFAGVAMEPSVPGPSDPTQTAVSSASPTLTFGAYNLLQRIGEGGMGEVWLAEQKRPVHRRVALKIIKAGMDSAQVVARFEAERQALALMDHPAIATVFDGGTTPQGRPYFAMEYVKGEPITTYCDRQRLDTKERLELFIRVCEGVQHAHQKGVIHRDLKPSNVLVTERDGRPTPKIIDFGIAKATTQHLSDRTIFTEFGVLIGTPEYMSPEQAELTGLDVDTRTDVYALGVLLYELLTGTLPFDGTTLRQKGLDEIRRVIREVEPPRPSTRITQRGPASLEAAKNRDSVPARLASRLRGDLDWITMKALEKERTRRYDTVTGLANDVRRHLHDEPVLAGRPGAVYRTKKFVRRHRFGVAAASVFVFLLVTFAAVMAVQAERIAVERDRANREAESARRVSEFLVGLLGFPNRARRQRTALLSAKSSIRGRIASNEICEDSRRSRPGC